MIKIFQSLQWHWARNDVAADHNLVHLSLANLLDYSLKSRKIPVDIIECSHSHH
jgi:hypothetical protein